jgi:hypothetical protein
MQLDQEAQTLLDHGLLRGKPRRTQGTAHQVVIDVDVGAQAWLLSGCVWIATTTDTSASARKRDSPRSSALVTPPPGE